MSLYKEFSTLLPYLQSIRKLKNYLSFDVSIPVSWKLPKKYVDEEKVMEQQSKVTTERLISFVSEINEDAVEKTSNDILSIIKYNLDREEKEKLFQDKVSELKVIFEKQTLRKLKTLSFEIKNEKIELEDGEEELRPSTEMVGE
jgi:hypothetical protein